MRDQASDLWEQLELVSELESALRDTVDWGKIYRLEKLVLLHLAGRNNCGAI